MSILATCTCGQSYDLKDEYAGALMQCPTCGKQFQAGGPPTLRGGDPAFSQAKYLLRQKHLSISQKYFVWDERGGNLMFVLRPAHLARNVFAALVGLAAGVLTLIIGMIVAAAVSDSVNDTLGGIIGMLTIGAMIVVTLVIGTLLSKKRHVYFYRDESQQELLLEIKQEQKFILLNAFYTLCTPSG